MKVLSCLIFGSLYVSTMFALGVADGSLSPCTNQWNCVITQEIRDQKPSADAIVYSGSRHDAYNTIKRVLMGFDRVALINEQQPEYLHVTFASSVFGFVDDVECYLPADENVIHIRSASRMGLYDFGVNKRRVNAIKKRFQERA